MTEQTPSTRAGLRNEIAAALEGADYSGSMRRGDLADAVMPVLHRAWPWLRAEADAGGLTDPEVRAQLAAVIKALGASETENKQLRARIATLEHVAAGNKRHVQLIVPDLQRAEAALTRVRAAVHIADERDATDWQRGYRACSERALAVLNEDQAPASSDDARPHVYLSTGCYHGDHAYCQAMTGLNGAKRPASRKKCGACCICPCHRQAEPLVHIGGQANAEEPPVPRDPCPYCESSSDRVPRALLAEHIATIHPEQQP